MKGSFGFASSAYSLFRPLIHGASLVVLPPASVSNAHAYVAALESHSVSHFATIPALLREVLRAGGASLRHRLRRLKVVGTSGGVLSDSVIGAFAECLPQACLVNGYSSTEVGTFATRLMIPSGHVRKASIGTPYDGAVIRLVDPQLQLVAEGTVGEICVGSPYLSNGYLNRPAATAQRFIADPAGESPLRFFRTGDVGRLLPSGEFECCGRLDLQLKVRGMRVGLESVEDTLRQLDGVQDVAVATSGPDSESRLSAYVVAAAGSTPSLMELRVGSKALLPDHMIPARFALVDELPRTRNGKIDRAALSQADAATMVQAAHPTSPSGEERSATERRLAEIWQAMLAVPHVDSQSDFFKLGGDSLSATVMLARVEQEFGLGSTEPGVWDAGLAAFLATPKLASLVAGVDEATARADDRSGGNRILSFNAGGSRMPIVFFPAAVDGLPFYLHHLADAVGLDQPFYVIAHAPVAVVPHSADRLRTIEEIAAEGIVSLRRILPPGPVVLAGHCYGGVLAYEAAHQLLRANQPVERLLLFDAWAPGFPKPLASWRRYLAALRNPPAPAEAWKHLRTLMRIAQKRSGARVMRMLKREGHLSVSRLSLVSLALLADYRPIPLPLEVVQFLAKDQPMSTRVLQDPRLGWRDWLGDRFRLNAVPGDHFSMFQPPHAATLAQEIGGQNDSKSLFRRGLGPTDLPGRGGAN
jgi:thioesterase domain-containing protein